MPLNKSSSTANRFGISSTALLIRQTNCFFYGTMTTLNWQAYRFLYDCIEHFCGFLRIYLFPVYCHNQLDRSLLCSSLIYPLICLCYLRVLGVTADSLHLHQLHLQMPNYSYSSPIVRQRDPLFICFSNNFFRIQDSGFSINQLGLTFAKLISVSPLYIIVTHLLGLMQNQPINLPNTTSISFM